MNQGTKQRIVGTVVLLTLAFIFLPIIFDGQGSYQPAITSRIPDPPGVSILPKPVQNRPIIIAETEQEADDIPVIEAGTATDSVEDEPQAAQETVAVTTSEPVFSQQVPQLNRLGLPAAWVVQLASFADIDNAQNLLERLHNAGYKAYIRTVGSERDELNRVYVGPWVVRARADEYQKQLQEQFQLAGLIISYEVKQL